MFLHTIRETGVLSQVTFRHSRRNDGLKAYVRLWRCVCIKKDYLCARRYQKISFGFLPACVENGQYRKEEKDTLVQSVVRGQIAGFWEIFLQEEITI